jgi:hypothetical protein
LGCSTFNLLTSSLPTFNLLADVPYRTFFGLDPRLTVWIIAQLHLMFAAFVLAVPIFAFIVEVVGVRAKDPATRERYDKLAYEFVKLLSAAFATTAALGGFLTFVLFSTYPKFMAHLTNVFHPTFYIYGLLFFAESFTLYSYYYSWNRLQGISRNIILRRAGGAIFCLTLAYLLGAWIGIFPVCGTGFQPVGLHWTVFAILGVCIVSLGVLCIGYGRKGFHIYLGILLNIFGTVIMVIANSWATYMMSPPGLAEGAAGPLESHWDKTVYIGPLSDAFFNYLWMPLNIHRFLANIAFGGAICGAYAAVKFLGARSQEDKAHYDWMGYVGNFIAIMSLIPLPFAGYYLGREIYSFNPTMGQDMMGGTFSWTLILQAVFVGTLFIGGNYYIWSGMRRIPGGQRYEKFVPWMLGVLFFCFGVWLTPHNLPLGGLEKKFGLMPAKNAVIQLMIITTFLGFLLYRRANKKKETDWKENGITAYIATGISVVVAVLIVLMYASSPDLSAAHPEYGKFVVQEMLVGPVTVDLGGKVTFGATLRATLYFAALLYVVAAVLAFVNRGKLGQVILLGGIGFTTSLWLFQHGFTIMEKANPLVRHVAVCQVLMILRAFIVCMTIDIFLFRKSESLGKIQWGKMHGRSQFALILLCTFFVMNMGLMGFIRSGLRKEWHVVSVLKDTSEYASTPSNLTMALMVTAITIVFLSTVSFVFWIASLAAPKKEVVQ